MSRSGHEAWPHAAIRCERILHLYPGEEEPVVALRNVDLEVGPGELVAVLGPSGSGKSTLLALLSGILRPTAGSVKIAGHDVARMDGKSLNRLRATDLALLLQDPLENLLPYATPAQNVWFAQRGARRTVRSRTQRRQMAGWNPDEILAELGLDGIGSRPVVTLSGGQQQLVALATVLAGSPTVVLADEPTAHLDASGGDLVIAALKRASQVSGSTILIVTHDPFVARSMPRTITLNQGQIGTEGRLGDNYMVIGPGGGVQLPADWLAALPAGTTLLSIRRTAEGIELRPGPSGPPAGMPGPSGSSSRTTEEPRADRHPPSSQGRPGRGGRTHHPGRLRLRRRRGRDGRPHRSIRIRQDDRPAGSGRLLVAGRR